MAPACRTHCGARIRRPYSLLVLPKQKPVRHFVYPCLPDRGFAKAKEGIEDTIETKALNVELLMIFAAVGSALIGYWAEGAVLIFIFR